MFFSGHSWPPTNFTRGQSWPWNAASPKSPGETRACDPLKGAVRTATVGPFGEAFALLEHLSQCHHQCDVLARKMFRGYLQTSTKLDNIGVPKFETREAPAYLQPACQLARVAGETKRKILENQKSSSTSSLPLIYNLLGYVHMFTFLHYKLI